MRSFYTESNVLTHPHLMHCLERKFGSVPLFTLDCCHRIWQYTLFRPSEHTFTHDDPAVVQYLIDNDIVKSFDVDMDNALRYSARKGRLDVVKYLVDRGADIHTGNECAVRWASWRGHLDIVKYLVEKGADIHAWHEGALREASRSGMADVVAFLVSECQADVNAEVSYSIRYAAANGHLKVVQILVEQGRADIPTDALYWAKENGHTAVLEYLIKRNLPTYLPTYQ